MSRPADQEATTSLDREREDRVPTGGWYRQDLQYSLLYRPGGHADGFIRGWLDVTARLQPSDEASPLGAVFESLSDPKGPGRCTKCHSVDAQADRESLRVNWTALRKDPAFHTFTRFSHRAHLPLLDDEGCVLCHDLEAEADVMGSYEQEDPLTFASNFQPIAKGTCASCHTPEAAGDGCLVCHNYHSGHVGLTRPSAPMTQAADSSE